MPHSRSDASALVRNIAHQITCFLWARLGCHNLHSRTPNTNMAFHLPRGVAHRVECLLNRLRIGMTKQRDYLHRSQTVASPERAACQVHGTATHLFWEWVPYEVERKEPRYAVFVVGQPPIHRKKSTGCVANTRLFGRWRQGSATFIARHNAWICALTCDISTSLSPTFYYTSLKSFSCFFFAFFLIPRTAWSIRDNVLAHISAFL